MQGLEKLLKDLDRAHKALSRLDTTYTIVEFDPDQTGIIKAAISTMEGAVGGETLPRARQNVILGYSIGKLGSSRVAVFKQSDMGIPSDFGGVVYSQIDGSGAWQQALGKKLKEVSFEVDWNKTMT